jgi:hypothetical protein
LQTINPDPCSYFYNKLKKLSLSFIETVIPALRRLGQEDPLRLRSLRPVWTTQQDFILLALILIFIPHINNSINVT